MPTQYYSSEEVLGPQLPAPKTDVVNSSLANIKPQSAQTGTQYFNREDVLGPQQINQFVDKTFPVESPMEKLKKLGQDFIRPTGTMGGAIAGGRLGSVGGPMGTAAGSLVGALLGNLGIQGLQHLMPSVMGGPPQDPMSTAMLEGGGQELAGAVAKPLINAGGTAISSLQKAFQGKIPEALAPYFNKFPTLFKGPTAKLGVEEYTNRMGGLLPEQQVGTAAKTAVKYTPTQEELAPLADEILKNKDVPAAQDFMTSKLHNFQNNRGLLTDAAYRHLFSTNGVMDFKSGAPVFNPGKVLQEINTEPIYSQAIPSQQLGNTRYLMEQLIKSQSKSGFLSYTLSPWRAGLALGIGLEALTGSHMGAWGGAVVAEGTAGMALYGLEKSMGALMKNPTTARAMIEAARTPLTAPSSTLTGKIILNALKGTTGYMIEDTSGNHIPASINNQGKVVPDTSALNK